MATVVITGGTGLIGQALTKALIQKGYEIIILSRHKKQQPGLRLAEWDPGKGTFEPQAIEKADFIIHLAGANVAEKRWTKARKKEILESRTKSSALIVQALHNTSNKVRAVVSASATGWYGPDQQIPNPKPFREEDPPATDFLGATCRQWEESISGVQQLNKRLVILRTGIVLSNDGGAYKEFKKPMRFGFATILGTGRQVLSWIHIDDLVNLYVHAVENTNMRGVYNAVAPEPVSNRALIKTMAASAGAPVRLPVPALVLKALLGEMSIEVLKSFTVSARKTSETGFTFQYPTIQQAVQQLNKKAS
jgi:uncharacterized protein